ncbi:MAG: hypothetical protein OXO56_14245 [Gammaproteobacteria bacterium]|nr:hypothetical protein [Gammaproteobacteria bacterium]
MCEALPIAHAVGLELDQRIVQPVGLGRRGGIDHRRSRALSLPHVGIIE